jgi:DNA (cytosine-5)-methyltransferase 1
MPRRAPAVDGTLNGRYVSKVRRTPDPPPVSAKPRAAKGSSRKVATGRPLKVVGLFAGIGGIELGLQRAGHSAQLLCEIEPGAQAVLRARFPEIPLHDDVTTLASLPAGTDLLAGGFPCQDLSQAGKTAGIEGARSGLVGEVFRLIEAQRVPWVLLENVSFMLQLSKGRAMDVIVTAFETLGYRWAYRVVDSRAFGVPQRRERVYFLASLEGDPREVLFADEAGDPPPVERSWDRANGFYWTEGIRGLGWADDAVPTLKGGSTVGIPSPPAIILPNGPVVTPHIRDAERMQGFEPGWTEPSEAVIKRGHRWKLVGNAVTVGAPEWIGRRLREPDARGARVPAVPMVRTAAWPRAAFNVGEGRFTAQVSAWPERRERAPLHEFLEHPPSALSVKATRGFLSRAATSSLHFPTGFLERVKRHLAAVSVQLDFGDRVTP